MQQANSLKLIFELTWWLVTAIIVFAVIYPVQTSLKDWPFLGWNITFIILLVTFTRYIFLLQHTFIARHQLVKAGLIILMIPLTFTMVSGLNGFMNFIEEQTWEPLTGHLSVDERQRIEGYTWSQMLFFGMGTVISGPVFALRLFMSIWLQRNRPEGADRL